MKKNILLTLIIISCFAANSIAQTVVKDQISFGLETAKPDFATPNVSHLSSIALGGSIKYERYISTDFQLTGSIQYLYFPYNTDGKEFARSLEHYREVGAEDSKYSHNGDNFITVMVGSKYYFVPRFYGEAQVGLVMTTGAFYGNQGSFAFSPGVGFDLGKGFDVGVRYQGWLYYGELYNLATLRIAYSFKIK